MATEAQLARQAKLREMLHNPNVRRMLDAIAWAEGADYNTLVGGGTFDDYSRHPNKGVHIKRLGVVSKAAGRYQITGTTWNDLVRDYGFEDFTPETQDLAAIARFKFRRNALADVAAGDWQKAIPKLKQEWASFPGDYYGQGGKSMSAMMARLTGDAPVSTARRFDGPEAGRRAYAAMNIANPFALSSLEATAGDKYLESPPAQAETLPELPAWTGFLPEEVQASARRLAGALSNIGASPPSDPFSPSSDAASEAGVMVNPAGRPMRLFPQTDSELEQLDGFRQYDLDTRNRLFQLKDQLDQWNRQPEADNMAQVLDPLPTMFDDQIMALIDRVQV